MEQQAKKKKNDNNKINKLKQNKQATTHAIPVDVFA
jgi:hypothetical protein